MNQVTLTGALARDPELRYTPTGTAVFEATVAGEDIVLAGDGGSWLVLPWYHRVTLMGKPAEWMAERSYKAGDCVTVEGSLEYNEWETPEGEKRSVVRVKGLGMSTIIATADLVPDNGGGLRMPDADNLVQVRGNLTADPELRHTPAGDAVTSLRLAINERWRDREGRQQERTHFVEAAVWREEAERAAEFKKGDPVYVRGRLINEAWTDREGNKRNTTKIEAQRVRQLVRSAGTGAGPRTADRPAPPARPAQAQRPQPSRQPTQGQRAQAQQRPHRGQDIPQGDDFPPQEEDLPF